MASIPQRGKRYQKRQSSSLWRRISRASREATPAEAAECTTSSAAAVVGLLFAGTDENGFCSPKSCDIGAFWELLNKLLNSDAMLGLQIGRASSATNYYVHKPRCPINSEMTYYYEAQLQRTSRFAGKPSPSGRGRCTRAWEMSIACPSLPEAL